MTHTTEGRQLQQRTTPPSSSGPRSSGPTPTGSDPADVAWSQRPVLLLALALGALLAVRLTALRLNATDLFFDEAQYWFWSTEPAFGYYSKPPLIAWLIGLSTKICGVSELCIRLPAPLLHTATAAALYVLGRRLYDQTTGILTALVYATLPAVSLSSGIISTDVPLLLCWALALIGYAALLQDKGEKRSWWPALLLGGAIGAGLNAKYAMAWIVPCVALHLVIEPRHRTILRDIRLWAALAIGVALIGPNLAWNLSNSFATFSHTADNAKWGGSLIHRDKAAEFFGAQFGVFGPILFAGLLIITWRAWKVGVPESDRLLLAFVWPVLGAITLQALLSRAHANWAAVSYVAASLLVTSTLLREGSLKWMKASMGLHLAVLVLISVGSAAAGRLALPGIGDPFARTIGWREVASAAMAEIERARLAGKPYGAVITGDRAVSAELLYYMRGEPTPVLAWRAKPKPQDHFELTRPYRQGSPEPVLLVDLTCDIGGKPACFAATAGNPTHLQRFTDSFAGIAPVGDRLIKAGSTRARRISLYALTGYRGK